MTLLMIVVAMIAIGWRARGASILLLPVAAGLVYASVVLIVGGGRDVPLPGLAALAELGLAGGLVARRRIVTRL